MRWSVLLWLLLCTTAAAHQASDSYLTLDLTVTPAQGRWDIALRDLEFALGLDTDGDGALTWGEVRARHDDIARYALARLTLNAGGIPCALQPGGQQVDKHSDGAYTVLPFTVACPAAAPPTQLAYQLFFDLDPTHRGLLRLVSNNGEQTVVLAPEQAEVALVTPAAPVRQLAAYWREGMRHIWAGSDHLLFIAALLLPAVLRRDAGGSQRLDAFGAVLWRVFGIITAFTAAHALTLTLAVLGGLTLPARGVELAIAASLLLVAVDNLYPLLGGRRWLLAFGLGLIHGFGFAGILTGLGLSTTTLALALVGFNLGVETGQLLLVALFLPLAFELRGSAFYRRGVLGVGSVLTALVGIFWLLR